MSFTQKRQAIITWDKYSEADVIYTFLREGASVTINELLAELTDEGGNKNENLL